MSTRKIFGGLATAGLIALLGTAFAETGSAAPRSPSVKIAASLSLTGPYSAYGQLMRRGLGVGVAAINAKGGVAGRRFQVVYFDDQSSVSESSTIMTKIVQAKYPVTVHAILAPSIAQFPAEVRAGYEPSWPDPVN